MGIRTKLVLCLLAVLIPMGTVGILATHMFNKHLTERTETALANTLRLEAARISETLTSYAQHARNLAAGTQIRQSVEKIDTQRYSGKNPEGLRAPFIDSTGKPSLNQVHTPWPLQGLVRQLQDKIKLIDSSAVELRLVGRQGLTLGQSAGFSWEPADSELTRRSMQTAETLFGDAFLNPFNESRLGIVSPITSTAGEVVGALLLETRLGPIVDLLSKHEGVGNSSEAHITQPTAGGHTQFITPLRFDRNAAFKTAPPKPENSPVNQSRVSANSHIMVAKDYRGVNSILSVETIPETNWQLVVKIDTEEAYAPVIKMRRILSYAWALSIVIMLIGYTFCLSPIVRRLKRTALAANTIILGDLSAQVQDDRNDEIGHLARTIDTLAYKLEQDHAKRSEVEARLRHHALHDELTGLLNRKYANKVIHQLNANAMAPHSVIFLDLNGFKGVNDLYGHAAGDEVLKAVANRLTNCIPCGATLARWGGDEFVVIMPETDEKSATELSEKLETTFHAPIKTSHGQHKISCSIGLATSSETKQLEDVLAEADTLMYEQKKRQCAQRASTGLAPHAIEQPPQEDNVEVWLQPILTLSHQGLYQLSGAEAKTRLRTHHGEVLLPEDIRPEFRSNALIAALDRRAMLLSFQTLSQWKITGLVDRELRLTFSVNDATLMAPDFCDVLGFQLKAPGIQAEHIILAIPRDSLLPPAAVTQLKNMGIQIALSSVNAEDSTLDLLSTLQPDIAWINQQWLQDAAVGPHLVALCRERHLSIVCYNVKDKWQPESLHQLGIRQFQGELFDNPMPTNEFIKNWGRTSNHQLSEKRAIALP